MNGIHDVGGADGFGPVLWEENEPVFHEPWEGRMRAVHALVREKHRFFSIDESRHAVERIDPVYYLGSSYYQLWLLRMEALLIEKEVLNEEEITKKMAELSPGFSSPSHLGPYRIVKPLLPSTQRKVVIQTTSGVTQADIPIQPRFSPGTVVRAKTVSPLGHTRIPRYIRGKQGVIESIHGNFILPDTKVHEGIDLYQPVYRVCFTAQELWGEDAAPKDKVYIELWEDYLDLGGSQHGKE
jgi:nitrile hydratase beta subunit